MTATDHNYETAGDRASLAREAGVGKLSFISVLAGVLVAYGAFAVLAALVGAAATAVGLLNGLAVFLLAIVLIAAVSAIIASQVDADTIRTNLPSLGIPTS